MVLAPRDEEQSLGVARWKQTKYLCRPNAVQLSDGDVALKDFTRGNPGQKVRYSRLTIWCAPANRIRAGHVIWQVFFLLNWKVIINLYITYMIIRYDDFHELFF